MNIEPLNQNAAAQGQQPQQQAAPQAAPKKGGKLGFLFFVIYIVALGAFMLWQGASDKKWRAQYEQRKADFAAEVAAYEAWQAQNGPAEQPQQSALRLPSGFDSLPPPTTGGGRQDSALLFERAARQEAGPQEAAPTQPQEQLDYAAQVAAYEAQLKQQQDAQKARQDALLARQRQQEAQRAAQEAQRANLAQQQAAQQAQQAKPTLRTAPGSAQGNFGKGGPAKFESRQAPAQQQTGTQPSKLQQRKIL